MNKGESTYWDNSAGYTPIRRSRTAVRPRKKAAEKTARRRAPLWLSFLMVSSIFVMLCVSINLRASSEMREEVDQNTRLTSHIQNLLDENLALQEEIHTLKTDPRVIEREAKKIGVDVKVSVPVN